MKETKEIGALFTLLDDPDKEVFITVSDKIVSFGKPIIPNLENLWENTPDEKVQKRIASLIHRLHFRDLSEALINWSHSPENDLLTGTLLVSRLQHPELDTDPIRQTVEKMRRNIWLELNDYLTSLETTNVISTILYNYYQLKGTETQYVETDDFLVNRLLATKKGNVFSIGVLYLCACELLNIPIRAIHIPDQFILAWFNEDDGVNPEDSISFFLDPLGGQIYALKEVEAYFRRVSQPFLPSYLEPMNNTQIIQFQLNELARCFDADGSTGRMNEFRQLSDQLSVLPTSGSE